MNKKMTHLICVILLGTMILPINGLAEGTESTTVTSEMQQIVEDSLPKLSEPPKKMTETTDSSTEKTQATEATKEVETVSFSWSQQEPERQVTAGSDFYLKIISNATWAEIQLPQEIQYNPQKNQQLQEHSSYNQEQHSLVLRDFAQLGESYLLLTTTKAGTFTLSVKDKNQETLANNLDVTIAKEQVVVPQETQKSSEQKQTKENEKSNPVVKSKNIAAKANGITVGLTAPTTYRTYTDPATGTAPDYLTVSLPVSIDQVGLTGTSIELPYGFYPSKSDPVFKDFDNTTPIFSLVTPSAPSANSIVASYVNDTTNKKLIIRLKETKTTLETINLRFKFNNVYDAKIPPEQIVWNNLQAKVFDNTGTQIASSAANKTVKTNVSGSSASNVSSGYAVPSDDNYFDGDIVIGHSYWFNYLARANLDPSYDHQVYAEIPTGATLTGTLANKLLKTGITNVQDPSVPAGFTRYYQKLVTLAPNILENPATQIDLNFLDTKVTLNKTYAEGSTFSVNFGMKVKFLNGKINTLTTTKSYTKRSRPDFQLSGTGYHSTVSGSTNTVNNLDNLATAGTFYTFGYGSFSRILTIKNTGAKPIQGVTYKLQELTAGSAKGNFTNLYISGLTDGVSAPAYYRPLYHIKNAVTGTSRSVWSSTPARTGSFSPALPTLATNEYISTIDIIPMGTDGTTANSLPPGNGMVFRYGIKSWPTGKWPDGTVLSKMTNPITFGATMQYQDATGTPTELKLNNNVVYYNKGVALRASVYLTSVNSENKLPGDTINYEISGRNSGYYTDTSSGDWENPIITIKVPKQLRLKATTKKDYIDESNQVTYPASVTVETLAINDTTYNYYRFKTSSTAYKSKVTGKASFFRIPLEFVVDSSAASGSYQIPYIAYSSPKPTDFFHGVLTQLSAAEAKKIGVDNTKENSYEINSSPFNIGFSVVDSSKLDSATNARGSATQAWSNTNIFAVDRKGTPQMQTVIKNSGNTNFTSVRLYNILPSSSDGRGSTGSIGFTNLTSNNGTAKIYYTTKPISQLPSYTNNDLQAWNATKLTSLGFTTTKPANSALITAIYVDFGATTIKPGGTLDAIMNFLVPDADNQKAINQFQYSAKEAKAGATLAAVSDKITFSTEFAQVAYEQNLPSIIVPGSGVKDLPSPQTIQLDVNDAGKIVIPTAKPTLNGYTFVEWQDVATPTKKYQPGATISFTSMSTTTKITLQAIWKPISVNVTFNANGGSGGTAAKAYTFGTVVNLSTVVKPTRTGYTFQGWATTASATTPDITTNPLVNYASARTYYAVWKGNAYTVKFDANGGTGTMPNASFIYGTGKPLPANTFTKESNTFLGWSKTRTSAVVYTDKQIISTLTATNNGTVTLYAKWSGQRPVLMGTPSTFDFGKQTISPTAKSYGLNSASYVGSPELQQAGFMLRLEDNRPTSTGWKLNVSLSEFKDKTGKSLPQGEGIALNFADTQLQKVQYANTAEESVTTGFTNGPTLGSQAFRSGATAQSIITATGAQGSGTWQLYFPFEEIKLTVPANVGEISKVYQSTVTWSLDDVV
ncbi:internalin like repeat domain-containing protein [Enterococcus faecalis]|uniref:WxL domain-containing protein n=1 Tax=Enterococcus faecalis TaxID=1351 RepID=UPI000A35383A|nr:InlB B-repeat-containing protein [Enterococcus faecalis]OTP35018.1 internalin like repeat domain-containing protein [Enterococcus faecalis]